MRQITDIQVEQIVHKIQLRRIANFEDTCIGEHFKTDKPLKSVIDEKFNKVAQMLGVR